VHYFKSTYVSVIDLGIFLEIISLLTITYF